MKIVIGCDNAAIELKTVLLNFLNQLGMCTEDVGCFSDQDNEYYPLIAQRVCQRVQQGEPGETIRGVLLCGTGIGMAMTANKFKGIRAAVCHDTYSAQRSILSNNGNVLCLGARVIGNELAKVILGEWISLEFKDSPSTQKLAAIQAIESRNFR